MASNLQDPVGQADRRQFPRIGLVGPVEVSGPRGGHWTFECVNVSLGGVQLRGAQPRALALVGECREAGQTDSRLGRVRLRLSLPGSGGAGQVLTARARVVYASPTGGGQALLGLELTDVEEGGLEALQAYLLEALRD
jgi:hypothetical protein